MIKTMKSELKKAQKDYIKARTENETIEQIEKEVKTQVLKDNEFYIGESSFIKSKRYLLKKRILDPMSDFKMNDEDFVKYCKLCYAKYLKAGLNVPNYDTVPNWKSFKQLKKAENNLLKIGIDITVNRKDGKREDLEKVANHWKYRYEMLDLIVKLEL